MKKLFIVILYKTEIHNVKTINSFKKCNLFNNMENYFYFWDNSPKTKSLEDINYLKQLGLNIVYDSHIDNTPLAIAYNKIIAKYPDCDYYAIFDQDTDIKDNTYEQTLNKALVENEDINLFMPVIRTSNNSIYSPGKNILPGKNKKLKTITYGRCKCKNLVGITSGIVISANYMKNSYKFNEKLKLYGVDTDFFYHYTKDNDFLYLLNVEIIHDLSFENPNISTDEKWLRFLESNTSYFDIYEKKSERFFVHIWLFYYKIMKKFNILKYK